ncbi:MAG: hypothetical protein ACK4RS_00050 [Thiothrix sp.]
MTEGQIPSISRNGIKGYRVPVNRNGTRRVKWQSEAALLAEYMNLKRLHGPCEDLLFAVLRQALIDAEIDPTRYKKARDQRELARDKESAQQFFASGQFIPYAELLNLSPLWVLRMLRANSDWFRFNPHDILDRLDGWE